MQKIDIDKWYSKDEIMELLPIGVSTYKKRIKVLESPFYSGYTKMVSKELTNSNLKQVNQRLIKGIVIPEIFGNIRMPSLYNRKKISQWIELLDWDWFCNIVPSNCYPIELKSKMEYFYKRLKDKNGQKHMLQIFYSIERNTADPFFHCHFLIRSSNKELCYQDILKILNDISEENSKNVKRIFLKPYDYKKHGNSGVSYTNKSNNIDYGIIK
jgi:hypothetical protein